MDRFRMYGLVPYNISPIQQGIQFGHAVQEYNNIMVRPTVSEKQLQDFNTWRLEDKTFIILNGGTTNKNIESLGTLNQHLITLEQIGIRTSTFYEPDLGDQLTAIVFLVPEQVYNREKYPDNDTNDILYNISNYEKYSLSLGGEKNVQLREFLKQFRLA